MHTHRRRHWQVTTRGTYPNIPANVLRNIIPLKNGIFKFEIILHREVNPLHATLHGIVKTKLHLK